MRLKRETQGAFCVLNANAKSQTRKSMKINVICTVAPLFDPGTDCKHELPAPADPPAIVDQEMDSELQNVFIDVVSLPTMVTPVSDMDRALCAPEEQGPVIAPPAVSTVVIWPYMATTSAGPKRLSPILPPASPTSMGVSPTPRTPPVVAVPEDFMLFNAAMTNQTQPETSPSLMGDVAGGLLPAIPQMNAPGPEVGLDAVGGKPEVADQSREGPFDIHRDHPRSVASPQLLQDTQGCLFRMTSYDVESDGPNFAPEHGVQFHDPRFLEYVGAPEPAQLMSRSPEYWVHHMGRDNALSVALQLQHDAGLILSNVQVLQQLVTSLCQTSSDVLLVVYGRWSFPSSAVQQVMPSYRVRRAEHYMMAMGLWHPPVDTGIRTPMPSVAYNACTSCQDCCPKVPM